MEELATSQPVGGSPPAWHRLLAWVAAIAATCLPWPGAMALARVYPAHRDIAVATAQCLVRGVGPALRELFTTARQDILVTNSLETHDVPAVNSHCNRSSRPLVHGGTELFELRAGAPIRHCTGTPPTSFSSPAYTPRAPWRTCATCSRPQ